MLALELGKYSIIFLLYYSEKDIYYLIVVLFYLIPTYIEKIENIGRWFVASIFYYIHNWLSCRCTYKKTFHYSHLACGRAIYFNDSESCFGPASFNGNDSIYF